MSSFTLYEITDTYLSFQDLVLSGEASEEDILHAMVNIKDEFEVKAESYAIVSKNLEGAEEAIGKEIERLNKKLKTIKNTRTRLKQDLELSMKIMDIRKFKTDKFSFNIQRNAPSVDVTNINEIDDKYIIIERKVDKTKIKSDLKAGIEVPGATLKESESLRIR